MSNSVSTYPFTFHKADCQINKFLYIKDVIKWGNGYRLSFLLYNIRIWFILGYRQDGFFLSRNISLSTLPWGQYNLFHRRDFNRFYRSEHANKLINFVPFHCYNLRCTTKFSRYDKFLRKMNGRTFLIKKLLHVIIVYQDEAQRDILYRKKSQKRER